MKLSRLMLSALAAAVALVACNKVETDLNENTSLKTVKLSLENVIMTKGDAGSKINEGDPVQVNNFKIILTDASYSSEFTAYDETGQTPATFYFTGETQKEYKFHFVDPKCTKVIAVANMGNVTLAQIKEFTEEIADQQNQEALVLWADSPLTATGEIHQVADHTGETTGLYTEVLEAELTLTPVISRFEVDGFVVEFGTTPKFNKIEVVDIAFDNYYPSMAFTTEGGLFNAVAQGTPTKYVNNPASQSDVFNWFNDIATAGWFRDTFQTDEVVMIPDDDATSEYENRADTPKPLAYHFYAGDLVPTMFIKLLADGNPAYVYTNNFISKKTSNALTKIEPGKIYRMSAAGEVDQKGGSVPIPEDLDPIKRCLDITVYVEDWIVELVTPEF